jgi:hypothetical protein
MRWVGHAARHQHAVDAHEETPALFRVEDALGEPSATSDLVTSRVTLGNIEAVHVEEYNG